MTNVRRGIAPLIVLIAVAIGAMAGLVVINNAKGKGPPIEPSQATSAVQAVGAALDPLTGGVASLVGNVILGLVAWRQRNTNQQLTDTVHELSNTPQTGVNLSGRAQRNIARIKARKAHESS